MATKGPAGYDHLLRDNYETPVYAPALAVSDEQLHQMAQMLKVSVADFVRSRAQSPQPGRALCLRCQAADAAAPTQLAVDYPA